MVILDALTYAGNLGTIAGDIDNDRCIFVKGDICDRKLVDDLFGRYKFDYVVNFAAESHVDRSIENPQLFLITNILGTQNLLDAARRAWVMGKDDTGYPVWREGVRYHQVSTDEVYGSLGDEGYFTEQTPLCPHSPYSASKTSADLFVMAYHDTYHMPVSITRCSNNYGPYHFPEKLIPLIIKNILEGKKLPVYGNGSNVRDWLYVEDHCKAIDLVVREGKAGEVYNVGGHNEKTNLEIVKLTIATIHRLMESHPEYRQVLKKKETGADGEIDISWINEDLITFVKDRLGHDQRYAIDPTKIREELGWYPETTFEVGIVRTIEWYLNHQEWVEEVTSGDYQKYYERMYHAQHDADEQHIARSLAQYAVQFFPAADDAHPAPRQEVEVEVDAWCPDELHPRQASAEDEPRAEQHRRDAQCQVGLPSEAWAEACHESPLPAYLVLLHVAVVVYHQQRVDDQSRHQREHQHIRVQQARLHIIRSSHGHEAEEHQHQHVTPSPVGQISRVEEGEEDARHAHGNQFPASVRQFSPGEIKESQAAQAGDEQRQADAGAHGTGRDPALGAGTAGAEAVVAVRSFLVIIQVVDEVGRYLHRAGEEQAEHGMRCLEGPVGESQPAAQQDGDEGGRQRLWACSQEPGIGGVFSNFFHICFLFKK